MLLISRSQVEAHLAMLDCIGLMRTAMIAVSRGGAAQPLRQYLPIPETTGKMAIMPGALDDPECFGIKLVCKYVRPVDDPLGSHVGMVLLFDSQRGVPLAMIEGSALTGIRTAAASGLATALLARPDATRLALIGTGDQALRHAAAMCAVRPIATITVWGRDRDRAASLCETIEQDFGVAARPCATPAETIAGTDIVCTTTAATTPVLFGADLEPGQHVNLVGAAVATSAEADTRLVERSRFYVDSRAAAMAAAGELLNAIAAGAVDEQHIAGEIGEVAAGKVPGRQSVDDITVYKSLGVSAQDLAAAHYLWRSVAAQGLGQTFDLLA